MLSLWEDYLRQELTEINHFDLLFYSLDSSIRFIELALLLKIS